MPLFNAWHKVWRTAATWLAGTIVLASMASSALAAPSHTPLSVEQYENLFYASLSKALRASAPEGCHHQMHTFLAIDISGSLMGGAYKNAIWTELNRVLRNYYNGDDRFTVYFFSDTVSPPFNPEPGLSDKKLGDSIKHKAHECQKLIKQPGTRYYSAIRQVLTATQNASDGYVDAAVIITDHQAADGTMELQENAIDASPQMAQLLDKFKIAEDIHLEDTKLLYSVYVPKKPSDLPPSNERIHRYQEPDPRDSGDAPPPYKEVDETPKTCCYIGGTIAILMALALGLYAYHRWFHKQYVRLEIEAPGHLTALVGSAPNRLPALKYSPEKMPLGKFSILLPHWKSPEFRIFGTNHSGAPGAGRVGLYFADIAGERDLAVIDDWSGLEKAHIAKAASTSYLSKENRHQISDEDLPNGRPVLLNCGYDPNHTIPLHIKIDLTSKERLRIRRSARMLAVASGLLIVAGISTYIIGPMLIQTQPPPPPPTSPQSDDLCAGQDSGPPQP